MPTLSIDGQVVEAPPGATVWEAARRAGIVIPSLCHHPDLSSVGSCRLCLVEVDAGESLEAACMLPALDGMTVRTETPKVAASRKFVLEGLLSRAPAAGAGDVAGHETEFQHWLRRYGARPHECAEALSQVGLDGDAHPLVGVDWNKCILCTRCIRACNEVQGRFVWHLAGQGDETHIVAGTGTTMLSADCESCGACAAYCPTGAMLDRAATTMGRPDRLVATTCPYCGVGCQFDLNVTAGRVDRVTSRADAPVNGHALCVKGRYGYDFIHHPDRLTHPRVRGWLLERNAEFQTTGRRTADRGPWVEVTWDSALDLVARRFAAIKRESGPDALGVFSSAKCTNEENYLVQKLARQVLGTNNVDHCARLCHSSTVAGLTMCYGSGATSNSMDDVAESAQAMFLIGSNVTEQHPVFGSMIRQAVLRRGLKLVVADPRGIDITQFATLHLRQRPGTDAALINGLMHIILARGWYDQSFVAARCEGFEEFRDSLQRYPPRSVSDVTGVPVKALHEAAEILAINKPMAAVWAMGITQHTTGVLNVLALGNLQMLLGNLGVPGGGVNPLRGQNNVQGACDMGALPNVYPGYQPVAEAAVRAKFASAWALGEQGGGAPMHDALPASPGLTITEMIDAAGSGKLRGLYIVGENPAVTDPDANHVRKCLAQTEFVVLQEIFPSATSELADVLLCGASFAEKTGTFTNTERRVQLCRQAVDPPGEARADSWITAELARRVLAIEGRLPAGRFASWEYRDADDILAEVAALTPSYAGVSHARLERGERLQWPVEGPNHSGTPILFVERFPRGLGKFHVVDHLPPRELPDREFPLLMTTGRVLYHWHAGEMTRRVAGLVELCPEALLEIHPADAARCGVTDASPVIVHSRRGQMRATARVTDRVGEGVVFGNFHFPADANVNNVTIAELDPIAKIPEYKVCAVRIERD